MEVAKTEKLMGSDLAFAKTFSSRDFPLGTGVHKMLRDEKGEVIYTDNEQTFEPFGSQFVNLGLTLDRQRDGY